MKSQRACGQTRPAIQRRGVFQARVGDRAVRLAPHDSKNRARAEWRGDDRAARQRFVEPVIIRPAERQWQKHAGAKIRLRLRAGLQGGLVHRYTLPGEFAGSILVTTERAQSRAPAEAAAEAVKAYIRTNRARLARDAELLALLLPDRFACTDVRDLQRYAIDRLAAENVALRAERDGLRGARERAMRLGEGIRHAVLELVDARGFDDVIAVAKSAAPAFGADRAGLCVEGEEGTRPKGCTGVRLIAPGVAAAVLGRDGLTAVLSGGGNLLLGAGGSEFRSIAVFRLKIGGPAALYVLGARKERLFEGEALIADLAFFARALERAIRAWLDLPRL